MIKTYPQKTFIEIIDDYFNSIDLNKNIKENIFLKKLNKFINSPTVDNFALLVQKTKMDDTLKNIITSASLSLYLNERYKGDYLPLAHLKQQNKNPNHGEFIFLNDKNIYLIIDHENSNRNDFNADLYKIFTNNDFEKLENKNHVLIGIKENLKLHQDYEIFEHPDVFPDIFSIQLQNILSSKKIDKVIDNRKKQKMNV